MIFPFFLLPVVFYEGLLFDLEISLHLASVDLLDSTFKHTIKLEKMKLVFIFVANLSDETLPNFDLDLYHFDITNIHFVWLNNDCRQHKWSS